MSALVILAAIFVLSAIAGWIWYFLAMRED